MMRMNTTKVTCVLNFRPTHLTIYSEEDDTNIVISVGKAGQRKIAVSPNPRGGDVDNLSNKVQNMSIQKYAV